MTSVGAWPAHRKDRLSTVTPRSAIRPCLISIIAARTLSGVIALRAPISSSAPQIHPQPLPFCQPANPSPSVSSQRLNVETYRSRYEVATMTTPRIYRTRLLVISTICLSTAVLEFLPQKDAPQGADHRSSAADAPTDGHTDHPSGNEVANCASTPNRPGQETENVPARFSI